MRKGIYKGGRRLEKNSFGKSEKKRKRAWDFPANTGGPGCLIRSKITQWDNRVIEEIIAWVLEPKFKLRKRATGTKRGVKKTQKWVCC